MSSLSRCLAAVTIYLSCLCQHLAAQAVPVGPPAESAPLIPGKPLVANICPRFALIGVPQKIRLYGQRLDRLILKSEEQELTFSEYVANPDQLAVTFLLETQPTTQPGKRILTLQREGEQPGPELTLYLLKRADRAILQKDLARCPWMREVDDKTKKK